MRSFTYERAASPAEAAEAADVLLICVSDDAAVEAVLWGESGAGPALVEGSLVIDCSTISPATSQQMAPWSAMP